MVYKCCVVCDFCGTDIFTRAEPAKPDWMRGQALKIGAGFYERADGASKDICRECKDKQVDVALGKLKELAVKPLQPILKLPKTAGFYWGYLIDEEAQEGDVPVWQVMHVVIISDEQPWPKNLGAMVPGLAGTYVLDGFKWSPDLTPVERKIEITA